jgi:hypothetical protein
MDYIQDPGHGWFKVSIKQLVKLGIADRISNYSYRRGTWAYLEEDCDATILFNALRERGIEPTIRERVARERRSKIRNYSSYKFYGGSEHTPQLGLFD